MAFPCKGKTNKRTVLIRFGEASIVLQKGTPITIYDEDAPFGTVSIVVAGAEKFGTLPVEDYDKV